MASLNTDGTHISQSTLVVRHIEHSIQVSDYSTDTIVEELDTSID